MLGLFKNQNSGKSSSIWQRLFERPRWRDSGRRSVFGDYKILEYKTEDGKVIEEYEDLF